MKRSRVWLMAGAGVVVAALIGGGIWLFARPDSAQSAAERYAGALAAGDADAMRALLAEPDAISDETWAMFESASAYPEKVSITELDASDDEATAKAEFDLDGQRGELGLALTRTDEGWRVAPDPLPAYRVTSDLGSAVSVGDVEVALSQDDDGAAAELELLPAEYTLAPAPAAYLEGEATLHAGTDDPDEPVTLHPDFTPQAQDDAEQQLAAHIDACVEPGEEVPAGCGLVVPWPADLASATSIEYRVDTAPAPEVDLETRSFQATGGALVVTVHGTAPDGTETERSYRTDDWSIYGAISIDDEGLLLSAF